MGGPSTRTVARPEEGRLSRLALMGAIVAFAVFVAWPVSPAVAGQAASGELLFYPCDSCHPVTIDPGTNKPTRPLPIEFQDHDVVLVGHDSLGAGSAACLTCHDDPARNPGMLKLVDGSLVDIQGDTAKVCYRCHSDKYKEWVAGTHGRHQPSCTAAGCHDPHSPGWIYAGPLLPFVGNGFQFKVLPEREAFSPLAPPAPEPDVETPAWIRVVALLGFLAAGGQAGMLIRGRMKR